MHATLLAIPAQRQDPPSEPEVRFMEAAANVPPAIRTWWYPGRTIGHEFIYPKDRRAAWPPAERTRADRGHRETSTEAMQTADLTRTSGAGEDTAVREESRDDAPAPRAERPVDRAERTELPRTASNLPLIGLAGLASLGAAVVLRRRRA